MLELDKERQAQYRQKTEEAFPNQYAIVNMDVLQKEFDTDVLEKIKKSSTLFNKKISCRYGQNPGSPAAFYAEERAIGPCVANMEVIKEGKNGLSYINIGDLDLAQRLINSLHNISDGMLIASIIKHEMPSGVARGDDPLWTYETARGTDSLSCFGGVVAFSYNVTPEVAENLVIPERNTEVVAAPSYEWEALEILAKREPLRVIKMPNISEEVIDNGLEYKRTEGGLLIESRFKTKILSADDIDCISEQKPTSSDIKAAIFAWHVAAYTRSNAVVIGTEDKIHGIGSGQRSRIDAAENAIRLAARGYGAENTFMASDAFMPATDVVKLAAKNNVRGIIYPLGSIEDKEVLKEANKHGLIMLVTRKPGSNEGGERCFLHR